LKKKDATKLREKFESLEAVLGKNQELFLMISQTAMIEGDFDKAKQYLSKAIKAGDISSALVNLRADIAYHKLWSEQFDEIKGNQAKLFETTPALEKTVRYFEEALMLDERHRETNMHLLSLLGRSDAAVSETALKSVELTSEIFLKPHNVGEFISVANVMARAKQTSRACDNYRYAKNAVQGHDDKVENDDAARLVKFEQKYPDLCL